jgi:hypothetical protein
MRGVPKSGVLPAAERHEQFDHINEQREDFGSTGDPIISVDTKKKS